MEPKAHDAIDSLKDVYDIWRASESTDTAIDSLISIIQQDEASKEFLRDMARYGSSSMFAARSGFPILGLKNMYFEEIGDYIGQSFTDKIEKYKFRPLPEGEQTLDAPNLRDIYLGYEEQDMPISPYDVLEDKVNYKDAPLYDINPYSRFEGFYEDVGKGTDSKEFLELIDKLDTGETMKIPKGIKVAFGSNIDLGQFESYIGRDEEGLPFFGVQDKWDFEGEEYSKWQRLMEEVGTNPMNMYGRWYFNESNPWYRGGN